MNKLTNKQKAEFINSNSDYWVMTPDYALWELKKQVAGVELGIEPTDFLSELELAECIKECISDPDKYVAVARMYMEEWEPATQEELDKLYREILEEVEE